MLAVMFSEHMEIAEGKQKVDLSYRKRRGHNARSDNKASRRKPHSEVSRIRQSLNLKEFERIVSTRVILLSCFNLCWL